MEGKELYIKNSEQEKQLLEIVDQLEVISEVENSSVEEKIPRLKQLVSELLEHLSHDLQLDLSPDVAHLYEEMSKKDLLARVERIKNILECLSEAKPIVVGDNDHHYANSVTTNKEGIRIAMSEARVRGPVRFLVGLDLKALVGFTKDHIHVEEVEDFNFDLRDTNLRIANCRHIVGEIHTEDIKYLIMRIPRKLFPENMLTPEELHTNSQFVFRGTKINIDSHEVNENIKIAA